MQTKKMSRFNVAMICILVTNCLGLEETDTICSEEFCAGYIKEKGCPELSEACRAQNSTHNGVYLPYPDICNCCDYCISNLALNDVCIRGSPGMPPPLAICGPGLSCRVNSDGPATCQPISTTCTNEQQKWDESRAKGTLGMTQVRPKCDDDGIFEPVHCIPGSLCYCVSNEGKRIFGEIPFLNPRDELKMTCGCSLNNEKALNSVNPKFLEQTLTARCNDYGLYDSLQCMMENNANCFCVDPLTGEPEVDSLPVPVTELKSGNPKCFDPSIHKIGSYESECEIMKIKYYEDVVNGVTSNAKDGKFLPPVCQPDGKFDRVQKMEDKKICVDPSGQQIGNYESPLNSDDSMDCKCARARWLLEKSGVTELPTCCKNGNFRALQFRRGEYFCVDCNGDQNGLEMNYENIGKLSCADNKSCSLSSCF